jgi:hypothetical protein
MAIKYTNIFHCKIPQKLPKMGRFGTMPSGNPEIITIDVG